MEYRVRLRWWPWWRGRNRAFVTVVNATFWQYAVRLAVQKAPCVEGELYGRYYGHWVPEMVEER